MVETESLMQNLTSSDVEIKKKAIFSVGEKKILESLPILMKLLDNDPDSVVRNMAARSLGKIGGKIHQEEILEALIKALNDSDFYVKSNACWSLGQIKDPRAIPHLINMIDPKHRTYAMTGDVNKVAGQSGAEASINLKEEGVKFSDIIVNAIKALGSIGKSEGLPGLIKALEDEDDGGVRCAACISMGKLKDKAATPYLISALNDKYWYVRRDAAKGLMKIKDPTSAKALANKFNDMYDEVRIQSLKALLLLGKDAWPEIFKLYLRNPKNEQLKQYIQKNLKKEDIVKILNSLISEESDSSKRQQYELFLSKIQ